MTTATSAIPPIYDALADAINNDLALSALLSGDRVYSLTAPIGAQPDYIVLGNATASSFPTFAREGEQGSITLHIWTAGAEGARCLAIYGELYRVLHLKPIVVVGHALLHGALSLTTMSPDPGGELAHLVATYRPTTLPT